MKKNKEHLPLYGIGPLLCYPMAMLSTIAVFLSFKKLIPCTVETPFIKAVMQISGILLILEGVILFFGADLNGNLQDNIKQNKLKTNGSYRFVRNPCYCLFLLGSTGTLLIAHNPLLLILPILFYIWMTVILKNTEEKWLAELYGEEYKEYCKRVNRCIPWLPR
jgi:protein-S-isoprenylcysteine O-methyltransferase Ste14